MPFPKLTTDRLILREIKTSDALAHAELFYDRETMAFFGGVPITSDLEINKVVELRKTEYLSRDSIFWVVTMVDEKEFIGFVRLMSYAGHYYDKSFSSMGESRNHPEFLKDFSRQGWEIDYALFKEYRNKGIMTEAVKEVLTYCSENNLRPIYAKVNDQRNVATVKLLNSLEFEQHIPLASSEGILGMIYRL
jgi:ribosomal-protein-alanine N-acetyltransferase